MLGVPCEPISKCDSKITRAHISSMKISSCSYDVGADSGRDAMEIGVELI